MRAAIAAETPSGLKAKDIIASGALVPDEVVVGIIADRTEQPDRANGFILDGFPRTVAQAEALDALLKRKKVKLDAVIQLRVNEAVLLQRVENRIAQMKERGEAIRPDDNVEALAKRLEVYRAQTEPLVHYYGDRRMLATVDGMMSINEVTAEIGRILEAAAAPAPARPKKVAKSGSKPAKTKPAAKPAKKAAKARKAAQSTITKGRAGKAARTGPKAAKKASRVGRTGIRKTAKKTAKKAVKPLAKGRKRLTKRS